jgi:hypothetical protein
MIRVVNKKTHKPTDYDFEIHRPFALGNPYTSHKLSTTQAQFQARSVKDSKIAEKDKAICDALNLIYFSALRHTVYLVCYCSPEECHGDVIKEIVMEKLMKLPMRRGDIVTHPVWGMRRITMIDRHVYPVVLEGVVGERFKIEDLTFVRTKAENKKLIKEGSPEAYKLS